jgi:glycosyltransferase involved in cell wall biosynthesis
VATWYRAADLYVIASDNEGLANTMIEALASGLPVLSTRVSGSSALIQRPAAGVLVDVGNMAALTAAMASLLQDDATRSALGNNARGTFERLFSLRTVTRKMIELYSTLLPRHRNRGTA